MAVKLENKVNIDAPDATWPFGNTRNNTGANDGTPYDQPTMTDYIQFFHKMMLESGIAYNDIVDNETNGWQFFLAFIENVRKTQSSTTQKGTSERATQTEVDTGTDTTRHLTAALLNAAKTVMGVDGSVKVRTKVIEIGDWDMDTDGSKVVSHGLADADKIRSIFVNIRKDSAVAVLSRNLNTQLVLGTAGNDGAFSWNDSDITLGRKTGGLFDSAEYNEVAGYNRGWITIQYEV